MNWVELHPPRPYTVVWRRQGESETFRTTVIACSEADARDRSGRLAALGLGANFDLWQVYRVVGPATETELVSVR